MEFQILTSYFLEFQNTLSFIRYPFSFNAYRYDIFVEATNKILNAFDLSDHAIFLLWRYTWDLMYLTLSSLYGFNKNFFTISRQQKNFYQEHFDFEMYQKNKDNAEIKDRAFGSNDRRFCAICVIRCSPYLLTRSLQSLNFPNSRTRPTTNGAFNSKSMPSFSTSQKRKSEKELI